MKLELKHLKHYPIGGDNALKITNNETCINERITGLHESCCDIYIYTEKGDEYDINNSFKLLLRPMSDLYKEIDGVVGIVELIHILCGADISDIKNARVVNNGDNYAVSYQSLVDKDVWFSAQLEYNNDSWSFYWEGELISFNQLELFEYLFSHHYDIYVLIDKGLAIDINSLGKEADNE